MSANPSRSTPVEINTDYLRNLLDDLLGIPSPTGYTDEIVRRCCAELEQLGVEYEVTRRGAIRAVLKGRMHQPARSVITHLDTIGALVKSLKDNGRLAIVPVGHWSARFAEGARCSLFTRSGRYRGTVLPLKASGHTFGAEIDEQPNRWENLELRVDMVATSSEELEELGIATGDFIAIDTGSEFLENGFIVSRHLDDKAGTAAQFAALKSLSERREEIPVDSYFLFSIAEEVGVGASAVLHGNVASMVTIDNGTTAPGQNSSEFGVTIAMADSSGPFDYHLTYKLIDLCEEHGIPYQRDIFRHYRCDSASAIEAGNDIRAALITFGIDASHGYERIHIHALESVAQLVCKYLLSDVAISRDRRKLGPLEGFTHQPLEPAEDAG